MNLLKLMKSTALLTVLAIGVTACSSKPEIRELPKSANAQEEITNLQVALENSRTEEIDILAPVSYKDAREALEKAREMEKDDKSNEKVLKKVALGKAYLERAEKRSAETRGRLQDVLAARDAAITAKANTMLPKAFSKVDKELKEETAKIENDKDDKLKEKRSDFITGYMDLELAAIKKYHLGESRFLIDQSIKNGARDLTPKTLATTNKKYLEADQFITQNRHETAAIETRSARVLTEARKLESTVATARGLTATTPEETAIRMQAEEALLTKTEDALAEEQGASMALAASNTEMSKDQQLNAIYEEARKKFSPEEAEVYKQGNNLVIRLRSLEFSASESVIKAEKFTLLKKVEDVIKSFDKSTVMVEGHTDSTGSKTVNQKLSDARAEAVKQYLEVNTADKGIEIESKGFGYEKPLATNKTPEGRAQNRRVDVIIEPAQI